MIYTKYINWILIALAVLVLFAWMMIVRTQNARAFNFNWVTCHKWTGNHCSTQQFLNHCAPTWYSGACPTVAPTATPTATPFEECDKGEVWEDEECVPEATPSAEPTATPIPEQPKEVTSTTNAPVCTDGTPLDIPANVHVVRSGSDATVNFFTNSRNAHIFYKEVSANDWQHSVRDIVVTGGYVSYTIHDLVPELGYTFGVEAANGCAGGETVIAVVVDGPVNVTFPLTYWLWAR